MLTRSAIFVFTILSLGCSAAAADGPTSATYDLDEDYSIETSFDANANAVTIALYYDDDFYRSVTLGNADIAYEDVAFATLCADCEELLFIPAYDRSSNYGATTGIIAWQDNGYWELTILPLVRPYLDDEDGDGISVLTDSLPTKPPTDEQYDFHEGLLSRLP
jgi:hypothetical protein